MTKKLLWLAFLPVGLFAQIGIGTSSPNSSSALDITSTTKGLLVPRLSTSQRNSVSGPADGLLIYNTDNLAFEFYDGGQWTLVGSTAFTAGTGIDIDLATNEISVANTVVTANYPNSVSVANLSTTGILTGTEIRISSLTAAQIAALSTPITAGRIVYQNDGDKGIYYFNGTSWVNTFGWYTNTASPASSFAHSTPSNIQSSAQANYGIGAGALASLTTGDNNTALGYDAAGDVAGGLANTAIGYQALNATTGSNNLGIGKGAGTANTVGSSNTFVGTSANSATNNLSNATALGYASEVQTNNTIQLGNGSVTLVNTSGAIVSADDITAGGDVISTGSVSAGSNITTTSGQIGIGTSTPTSSAALEISSTSKGLLLPRLTSTERGTITTPEPGLIIFNTTTNKAQVYTTSTTSWLDYTTNNDIALAVSSSQSIAQTFTAVTSESLAKLQLNVYTFPSSGTVTATVYDGSGTSGTVLGSTSLAISSTGVVNFIFTTPIPLTIGSTYTINLTATGGTSIQFWADQNNPYSGGGVIGVGGLTNWDLDQTLFVSGTWSDLN